MDIIIAEATILARTRSEESEESAPVCPKHDLERVVWIDPDGTDVWTIAIRSNEADKLERDARAAYLHHIEHLALPTPHQRRDLEAELAAGTVQVLDDDPYTALLLSEKPPRRKQSIRIRKVHSYERHEAEQRRKHARRCQLRDAAVHRIAPLTTRLPDILIPALRSRLIRERVATLRAEGVASAESTIMRDLRRWWQGGMVPNALLPHYDACGAKGRARRISERKRGRPSKRAQATGVADGVNIDDAMLEKILNGIRRFVDTRAQLSIPRAYRYTLEYEFSRGYELRGGVLEPVLEDRYPLLPQFTYYYHKYRDPAPSLKAREGERAYALRHRDVAGNPDKHRFGPGSIYQIDATVGDIYLVSSLDRSRLIGRPVIYMVQDWFSHLIVGFSVGLEGPSWLGAMLALYNATCDKVQFCAQYGIVISPEQWPACYIPAGLLGDRGELEGVNADHLVRALGIIIANTPPFRPDWKGIIERNFRLINQTLIHFLPGAVRHPRTRGDHDCRLDACLTLDELRTLLIHCILLHNSHHRLRGYRLDRQMIEDHVSPYPIDLWNWGVANRTPQFVSKPDKLIKASLLPAEEGAVTERGIRFRGLYYTCERAERENWFSQARFSGRWTLDIAYEPRLVDTIYLRLENGRNIEPCQLLERDQRFLGCDWHDVEDFRAREQIRAAEALPRDLQAQLSFDAQTLHIVDNAQAQRLLLPPMSTAVRVAHIEQHRAEERRIERSEGAWRQLADPSAANERQNAHSLALQQPAARPDDSSDRPVSKPVSNRLLRFQSAQQVRLTDVTSSAPRETDAHHAASGHDSPLEGPDSGR